jgi:hypothetical protein
LVYRIWIRNKKDGRIEIFRFYRRKPTDNRYTGVQTLSAQKSRAFLGGILNLNFYNLQAPGIRLFRNPLDWRHRCGRHTKRRDR